MDVHKDWQQIRKVFGRARRCNLHHAFSTIAPDGTPHVTPIGSLWLDPQQPRGIYFDVFNQQLAENLATNPRISILAVDSSYSMWLGALLRGQFNRMPGMRLQGIAGKRRLARQEEIRRLQKLFRRVRFTRGYKLLWNRIEWVREISFDEALPVHISTMTKEFHN